MTKDDADGTPHTQTRDVPEPKSVLVDPALTVTSSSAVGKAWRAQEQRTYWLQRRKFSNGELGTFYSATEFFGVPLDWNPA